MEFTGRLTDDAQVKTTKKDKKVVTFSVAINDQYKPKNGEAQKLVTYINCSYWLSTTVAKQLQKGSIVSVYGHIYLNQYKTQDGEQYANIACHANSIKILSKGKDGSAQQVATTTDAPTGGTNDDLPF